MLLQKKNILNVLLAIVACILGVALYFSLVREMPSLLSIGTVTEEKKGPKDKVYVQKIPVEATYKAVKEKNLFSPDRKEFIPEEVIIEKDSSPVGKVAKINGNVLELYGVIMLGGKRSGLVLNPERESARKYKWVTAGDKIGNMQVSKVLSDKLMLRDGRKTYEIKLRDKKKSKNAQRVSAPSAKKSPTVVSVSTSSKKRSSKKKAEGKKSSGETEVIHTPFGDIIRKK